MNYKIVTWADGYCEIFRDGEDMFGHPIPEERLERYLELNGITSDLRCFKFIQLS